MAAMAMVGMAAVSAAPTGVYIGTYTGHGSQGIYHASWDAASGVLGTPSLVAACDNPSFVVVHPDGKFLYAAIENKVGEVAAFKIGSDAKLTPLNRQASEGIHPCHLSFSPDGRFLLVANYSSGSVAVFPIEADGSLKKASCSVKYVGNGLDPKRQASPHAHSIYFSPDKKLAMVVDLGRDKLALHDFDPECGKLLPHKSGDVNLTPGSGPRHLAFAADGKFAYVINELDGTVAVLAYNASSATFVVKQTIRSLPADYKGQCWGAEVELHPNGQFLYASNRAHNSLAVFRVDPVLGTLSVAGFQKANINNPRHFTLDPSGKFLVLGNQDGDSVVVFRINPESGMPEPTEAGIKVSRPVCITWASLPR